MNFLILLALGSGLSCVNAAPPQPFVATFDDRPSSGILPEAFSIQPPYKGLAYPGFNNYNTAQGLTAVPAESSPNTAASITVLQMAQGQSAMITTAGTPTKSFNLKSVYNGCVVASQTGLVAEGCTMLYDGTKTDGSKVSTTCTFSPALLSLDNRLEECTFPDDFTILVTVSIMMVEDDLLPESTVVLIDNVTGVTYTKG